MNTPHGAHDSDPQGLARAYDAFIAARWRGEDETAEAGTVWFEAHWSAQAPPEPDDPPDAASVLGAAGHGIRWYARGEALLGYAGHRGGGCYRISAAEDIPAPHAPWDSESGEATDVDRVLHHAAVSTTADERPVSDQGDQVLG